MTADELADHLVLHFNAIADPIIAFQAINPSELPDFEKEKRADFAVYVIPTSESESPFDRGDTCDERRVVSAIIHGPIGNVTKAIAMQFGEQLRKSLYETEFDGYDWAGNETTTLVDYGVLKKNRQFLSRFDAEYYTYA